VIASFLPWGSVSFDELLTGASQSFNGFEGTDGWIAVGTAVVVLVFGALSFMPTPPRRAVIPIAIIAGIFLIFIGVANMGEPEGEFGSVTDIGGDFSPGIGLWVMILAGLLCLAGAGLMIASQRAAPKEAWGSATGDQPRQGYGQQPQQGWQQPGQYPPPQQPQQPQPGQYQPTQPQPGQYQPPQQPPQRPGDQPPPA
jgi:hypothetical protein